jgi:hypothetical protein
MRLFERTDPEAAVAELVRRAPVGAVVELSEPDATAWTCHPPHPAFAALRDELVAAYERTGRDLRIGRRAAQLLRGAGLLDVSARATTRITRPGESAHTWLPDLCERELGVDVAALRAHLARPDSITCLPLLWQAAGVKG